MRAGLTNQVGGSVVAGRVDADPAVREELPGPRRGAEQQARSRRKAQEQTIARKMREARISLQLERKLGKEEILAGYLNVVAVRLDHLRHRRRGAGVLRHDAGQADRSSVRDARRNGQQSVSTRPRSVSGQSAGPAQQGDRQDGRERQALRVTRARRRRRKALGLASPVRTPPNGCVGAGPENGFFCSYVVNYLQRAGFSEEQLRTGGYTIQTTLDRAVTSQAKAAAEAGVAKGTPGIANTMAVVRPGKERHEVLALVANRDYGLKAQQNQTTFDLPSGVENKFGAGSIYKVFTAAAALEKGLGIENVIPTPTHHVSRVFKGGAARCPGTGEPGTRWYCLSNFDGSYPSSMSLQTGAADLAEHRFRDPGGADRHGHRRRHGLPSGHARDDGDEPAGHPAGPEGQGQAEPHLADASSTSRTAATRRSRCRPAPVSHSGARERRRHHHLRRQVVPADAAA